MEQAVNSILNIQRQAWNNGHDNYGSALDVKATMLYFLQYFKHLNPAQKALADELEKIEELKFAKRLCSRAHKSVRHFIVTLK
ncbi:rIII lysis inhibition accessory protein rapid lysis phenotype [Acinetobacter phage Ac42]|uniref:lysis inhibition; accessory protein n=1 Tax=Acinetobacter phage Ac42 TaxID=762660 RepID=UPI0001EBCDFA|nr:lysis inhibition; accessory protein [Acinetobacter phage Ac42]ADI96446.1 rIII lysis inhibition accessory protein rapid lysis phenotype [Acinetobacter phage Ac42]